ATWKNDFVVLYNPTNDAVDVSTWSLQYASGTGTTWLRTNLSGSVEAYCYYLIKYASGGSRGSDLPVTPNVTGSTNISGSDGKFALCNNQITIVNISFSIPNANVVDFVGYGGANLFEGTGAAPSHTATSSTYRKGWDGEAVSTDYGGFWGNGYDTDNNNTDYTTREVSSVLPVELVRFEGNVVGTTAFLQWQTATETNNYGYEVERSTDQVSWQTVGFVSGAGNTNTPRTYHFKDNNLPYGTNFYRLKQMDNNGSLAYSKCISVTSQKVQNFLLEQNFPNPFNPSTTILFYLPSQDFIEISIYSLTGEKAVTLIKKVLSAGTHSIKFDAGKLAGGCYIMQLKSTTYIQQKKMLLIK
ncbi:MAG: T9SS type A sorting domain-containing protein, partial [Ignavibacteriales bacterium]|nr:T9SS type A sorting domain-containing protein [Ignavibacteriales bacterium]